MQPMMSTTGPGFLLFPLLHAAGALAVLFGIAFLLMWAYKHLPPAQLKKWGWVLLIGGVVVCFLTLAGAKSGGGARFMMKGDGMMRGEWMEKDGERMMEKGMMNASSAASVK